MKNQCFFKRKTIPAPKKIVIDWRTLKVGRMLGCGGFGSVWVGRMGRKKFAVKQVAEVYK